MRIFDKNNVEIVSPDLSVGYLEQEEIFVKHHEATEAVEEQWHYETVAEYPNGGKDVVKVIDVPGVEAKEAWDEYETILRYIIFPKPTAPRNLMAGEYITIKGTLYKVIANILADEYIIVGDNVIETTIEAQLTEFTKNNNQYINIVQNDTDAMLIDHEYRLTLLELGIVE